ncbi:MAG: leucine--tRNA ligase [Candidatus Pacearchaeota archaeon]
MVDSGYDFKKIEKKWQDRWKEKKIFEVKSDSKKEKFYCLEMFPYPSGSGLHIGHSFNYTLGDVQSRFWRMKGKNVLYPAGYDSFGLPAENAAIKAGEHPKNYTKKSIKYFSKQQYALGLSYDWSRMIATHEPDYFRWDQWIFLKLFEKGLVYKKKASVNWCPKCNTVLANEQVHNGRCEYHADTDVEIRHLDQWYFKITDYVEELNDFSKLEGWPSLIKKLQKNWIGKSYGTEILFEVNGEKWPIFTTRPDTLFGVSFMVISAQHSRLMEIVTDDRKEEVKKFLKKVKTVSEKSQGDDEMEKEGVFTGSYAINPLNKDKVPIYAGNFVLAEYGSGMVMAVPAHDQRDFEFAVKYDLPIKVVIEPKDYEIYERNGRLARAYTGEGYLVNSGEFNELESQKAKEEIRKSLEKKKSGTKKVQYRLRDWLVSRQRYWGTPIPIVNCDKCGSVPVPEKNFPVELPDKVDFGKGNPLETNEKWINTKCPKCGGKARRETDTMDTFVNSSWYYLRYCDPDNNKKIFDSKKADYWCPIDFYIGGKEHATMHLIFIRFYTKFLRDLGLLDFDEPVIKLFNQGMVQGEDGRKMSKSLGNVVDPMETIKKYGADSLRLFIVSVASPDSDFNWSDGGVENSYKFIKKVYNYFSEVKIGKPDERTESKLNRLIIEIENDLENIKYNLAIIKLKKLFESLPSEIDKKVLERFLKLLHPFCPHITEELWEGIGNKGFISVSEWPNADKKKINEKFEKQEQATENLINDINSVLRIVRSKGSNPKTVFIYVLPNEIEGFEKGIDLIKKSSGLDVRVYSVSDKERYDPENKSKKVKPGKPGIYLE